MARRTTWGRWTRVVAALAPVAPLPAAGASTQGPSFHDVVEARVWLDRGRDPVLGRGDRVRVYYWTSADAYAAIVHVDTDGNVHLVHPRAPGADHHVTGGLDYQLLFARSPYWYVDEYEGRGYYFLVAATEPFDFTGFARATGEGGWDLTAVARAAYVDPYLAADRLVDRLVPRRDDASYAVDFAVYDVGGGHAYPRFLCYDCHGFRPVTVWNPYTYACASVRLVIWNDPYYAPAYRYGPTRVVYASPPRAQARFAFEPRARGEPWSPVTRSRPAPPGGRVVERTFRDAPPGPRPVVPPRREVAREEDLERGAGETPGAGERLGADAAPGRGALFRPAGPGRPSQAEPAFGVGDRSTLDAAADRGALLRPAGPGRPSQAVPAFGVRPTFRRQPAAGRRVEPRGPSLTDGVNDAGAALPPAPPPRRTRAVLSPARERAVPSSLPRPAGGRGPVAAGRVRGRGAAPALGVRPVLRAKPSPPRPPARRPGGDGTDGGR